VLVVKVIIAVILAALAFRLWVSYGRMRNRPRR